MGGVLEFAAALWVFWPALVFGMIDGWFRQWWAFLAGVLVLAYPIVTLALNEKLPMFVVSSGLVLVIGGIPVLIGYFVGNGAGRMVKRMVASWRSRP